MTVALLGACTNDYNEYEFSATGGSPAGGSPAGGTSGGGNSAGGTAGAGNAGGSAGAAAGGTGATSSCPSGQELCGTACINVATSANNCGACGQACPAGFSCQDRLCRCSQADQCGSGNSVECSGTGRCGCAGNSCEVGETCTGNGGNVSCSCNGGDACDKDRLCCPAGCVNPASDEDNCGACGHKCASGQTCNKGQCQ